MILPYLLGLGLSSSYIVLPNSFVGNRGLGSPGLLFQLHLSDFFSTLKYFPQIIHELSCDKRLFVVA